MNDQRRWWYAAAWLFVVGAVAFVSWSAIARAGREAALLGAPAGTVRPLATPGATTPDAAPSAAPAPTGDDDAEPSPTAPTHPPVAAPASSPRTSSAGRATSTTPATSTGGRTTGDVPTIEGSTDVRGGRVAAACRGDAVIFRSAQSADGWSVRWTVQPTRIEVEFTRGEDHTEVTARCVNGAPAFHIDS